LAAAVTGDEHPLLTVIAEHSVVLLAVVRAIVEEFDGSATPPPDGPPGGGVPAETPADAGVASRYQSIAVTVEE
jgi:hypothetical protein